jgi:hypothetical protein
MKKTNVLVMTKMYLATSWAIFFHKIIWSPFSMLAEAIFYNMSVTPRVQLQP